MGGLAAAYHDSYNVNIINPASLPYLRTTSFETGLNAKYSNLTEGEDSFTNWGGSLSYFSLAFPLSNPINDLLDRVERKYELGMSFSLQPFSTVGYNIFTEEEEINGVPGVQRNYVGDGGTYSAQWGNGIKFKDFSAGINLGYLFGKTSTYRTAVFDDFYNAYDNYESINTNLSGFIWNLGVQYDLVLNQAEIDEDNSKNIKKITFGAYGNPGTSFKTSSEEEYLLIRTGDEVAIDIDTISEGSFEGTRRLPAKFGIGFMYNVGKKWGAGVNYETQLWSEYENIGNPIGLNNSFRISAGGFFRPDDKSITNYLKRIYYQFGVFYAKDPAVALNKDVDQYGATIGLGLPFYDQRDFALANVGATFGVRGLNTVIEERYIHLNFGFTFTSEKWFLKRKYK